MLELMLCLSATNSKRDVLSVMKLPKGGSISVFLHEVLCITFQMLQNASSDQGLQCLLMKTSMEKLKSSTRHP